MDGFVPRPPVRPYARAIPPVRVKFSITKSHHLRQTVQQGLEDGEEACEPDYE